MDSPITLESAADILVRCVVVGQSKGAYSIKDASYLYTVVSKIKTEKTKEYFDTMIKAIVVANSKGAYSLEEAALIEKIVHFLDKEQYITTGTEDKKEVKKD